VSGADQGAERAENRVRGSGAVSGHSRTRLSGNGGWRGRLRSESGCHKKSSVRVVNEKERERRAPKAREPRRRGGRSSAAGARIDAPKAPRG